MKISRSPDKIQTKDELVEYIKFLADEFRVNGSKWENQAIDELLDDMAIALENNGCQTSLGTNAGHLDWNNLAKLLWELSIWDIGH